MLKTIPTSPALVRKFFPWIVHTSTKRRAIRAAPEGNADDSERLEIEVTKNVLKAETVARMVRGY
jgi:hypothetical protein